MLQTNWFPHNYRPTCVCLQDDTAAGCWVIIGADFVVIAVDHVVVGVALPGVGHLSDGNQLHGLPLEERRGFSLLVFRIFKLHTVSFKLKIYPPFIK